MAASRRRVVTALSLLSILLWILFFVWYTPWGGPLESGEIDQYLQRLVEHGAEPERVDLIRGFLERDTGDDFVMVNLIEYREPPLAVEGVAAGDSGPEVLARYMEFMWPMLLRRACHPVLMGQAAAAAVDLWGLDGAERWSQAGLMRYRSRRDLMEIATDPRFGGSHEYKLAAMAKTIAFPIDPWFQLGDPRLVLGLVVAVLVLALQWLGGARRSTAGRRR